MKNVIIETANVGTFRAAMRSLADTEKGQPGFGLVVGQAGRGKTMAARNHYAQNPSTIYLRAWEGWTQAAFLGALCQQVTGRSPHSVSASKRLLVQALDATPATLLIDEADRLHISRIEDLRDIHDETGAPVVLIGEEELLGLLGERRRIWSRVTQDVRFGPVTPEDAALFTMQAAGLDLDPDACRLLVDRADGDFRLVRNAVQALESAAKAKQTKTVTVAMAASIVKPRPGRGRA